MKGRKHQSDGIITSRLSKVLFLVLFYFVLILKLLIQSKYIIEIIFFNLSLIRDGETCCAILSKFKN